MSLRRDRILHTWAIGQLLLFCLDHDVPVALDYGKRCNGDKTSKGQDCPVGKPNSLHKRGLAHDIHVYLDLDGDGDKDDYVTDDTFHRQMGEYWESLHPRNRWGGRYDDHNHYETLSEDEA